MPLPVLDRVKIPTAFWKGIAQLGISRTDVVQASRVPGKALTDGGPVSSAQFFALWQALSQVSGDPAVGIRLATSIDPAWMPPAFLVAAHARDFRDALQRIARFKQLCAPEQLYIKEFSRHCTVELEWPLTAGLQPAALVDASLAAMLELGRRGTRQHMVAVQVELARPRAKNAAYEQFFGCGIHWAAPRNRLTLSKTDLDTLFVGYNAELLDILTPELDRAAEVYQRGKSLTEQITWILRCRLAAGRPDVQTIARELAMSERSLQRRLTGEGFSFQQLLQKIRRQLAVEYLADPALDTTEVACMLGYEDQNSFYRAFRRWEGKTPATWRALHAVRRFPPDPTHP